MTTIRHEGVAEFSGRMARSQAVVSEELRRAVDRCTALGERDSKTLVPVVTGHLRRSITTSRAAFAGGVARGSWGTNVPYAKHVEFGRGPVVARPGGVLRFTVGGRVLYRQKVRAARPRPFLFLAARRLRGRFRQEFEVAADRIAQRLAGGR
jgi:hypothetical protein